MMRDSTVNRITSESGELTLKKYMTRHNKEEENDQQEIRQEVKIASS